MHTHYIKPTQSNTLHSPFYDSGILVTSTHKYQMLTSSLSEGSLKATSDSKVTRQKLKLSATGRLPGRHRVWMRGEQTANRHTGCLTPHTPFWPPDSARSFSHPVCLSLCELRKHMWQLKLIAQHLAQTGKSKFRVILTTQGV